MATTAAITSALVKSHLYAASGSLMLRNTSPPPSQMGVECFSLLFFIPIHFSNSITQQESLLFNFSKRSMQFVRRIQFFIWQINGLSWVFLWLELWLVAHGLLLCDHASTDSSYASIYEYVYTVSEPDWLVFTPYLLLHVMLLAAC